MKAKFGELFGSVRRERGLTLRDITKIVGSAPSYWSEVESGRRLPPEDKDTLSKLSKFLCIDENKLIDAAKADRVKKDTYVMEKLYSVDPELALGFFRAMEGSDDDEDLKDKFSKFIETLNKKG